MAFRGHQSDKQKCIEGVNLGGYVRAVAAGSLSSRASGSRIPPCGFDNPPAGANSTARRLS
jgi:hypothetical protein